MEPEAPASGDIDEEEDAEPEGPASGDADEEEDVEPETLGGDADECVVWYVSKGGGLLTVSVAFVGGETEEFAYTKFATIQNLKDLIAMRTAMDVAQIRCKLADTTCLKHTLLHDIPAKAIIRVNKVVQQSGRLQAVRRIKKGETKTSKYVRETIGDVAAGVVTMNEKADTVLQLLQNPGASIDDDLEHASNEDLQRTWPDL